MNGPWSIHPGMVRISLFRRHEQMFRPLKLWHRRQHCKHPVPCRIQAIQQDKIVQGIIHRMSGCEGAHGLIYSWTVLHHGEHHLTHQWTPLDVSYTH